MKQTIENLSLKKILLIGLPIIILLVIIIIVKNTNKEHIEEGKSQPEILLPDSKEEAVFENKVSAYTAEEMQKRKESRIERESQVKNSDFFKEVGEIGKEENIQKNESLEEYYERSVISKMNNSSSGSRTSGRRNVSLNTSWDSQMYDEPEESQDELKVQYEAMMAKSNQYKSGVSSPVQTSPASTAEPETPKAESVKTEEPVEVYSDSRRRRKQTSTNNEANLIRAAIHGDQSVQNGSTVRMRILEEIEIDGMVVPKNELFWGVANITAERLNITVSNIRVNNTMRPVSFEIYDLDSNKGLNIPDGIKKEIARQAKKDATNNFDIQSSAGGLNGIVTSGLKTVKDVLKKEQQQPSVPLKANYSLYIKKKK